MDNHQLSVKSYPLYKDSAIAWLGDVPEHWEVYQFKNIAFYQEGPGLRNWQFTDEGIKVISVTNITPPTINFEKLKKYISVDEYQQIYKHFTVQKGDLLLASSGASWGKLSTFNLNEKVILNTSTIRIHSVKESYILTDFIRWILQSGYIYGSLITSLTGSCQPNFGPTHLNRLYVTFPPLAEQKLIAAYLDTKTAQCDRKIDLLTQKVTQYGKLKQSLINETVTRGLDKSMLMKNSGIEWIRDVPEHWKVKRVKEVFTISRGRVIAQTELIENGHYPVYSSQTKDDGCLGYINTFDYEGDYITWTTDGVNAGTIFLRQGRFNCTNICGTLKLNEKNHFIGYLFYALQVSAKHNKRIDTNGAKIMSNEMMFIKISIPPLSEQKAIADYLDTKTAQIDQIIQTINTQIEKLKELRKTLINDVVTGKIKVV